MRPPKLLHLLELARFDLVLTTISNVWLMTFLAFVIEPVARRNQNLDQLGLGLSLLLGAIVATGLAVSGMALNDALDFRHDRTFWPDRPVPAGRVKRTGAVVATMLSMLTALAASAFFGKTSMLVAVVAAAGIVFYNVAGRFVPAAGIVCLGLIHALTMAIPNPQLGFGWPIALTMTHVIACAVLRHVLTGKRPLISPRAGGAICVAWVFWTMVGVGLIKARGNVGAVATGLGEAIRCIWIGPAVAVTAFVVTIPRLLRFTTSPGPKRRQAGLRFTRLSVLWLMLYDAGWLFGAQMRWPGLLILGLFAAAWTLSRPHARGPIGHSDQATAA